MRRIALPDDLLSNMRSKLGMSTTERNDAIGDPKKLPGRIKEDLESNAKICEDLISGVNEESEKIRKLYIGIRQEVMKVDVVAEIRTNVKRRVRG